jgi:SAM-dependent methyltransferase
MNRENRWEAFFDGHAPAYMDNVFTRNTVAEVDFLLAELAPPPGGWVLDVGCGTGRHSLELASRGYRVTGVDISEGMLEQARAVPSEVEWVRADVSRFEPQRSYDAVVCLCEGAFGLLPGPESDAYEHDQAILRTVWGALRPGGRFLLTTLNGYRTIRAATAADVASGRFDPSTMVLRVDDEHPLPPYHERSWIPPELAELMRRLGFAVLHVGGGTAGNWARRPLDLDEIEFMVIAEKSAG